MHLSRKTAILEKLAADKRYGDYAREADALAKKSNKAQARVRSLPSIKKTPWTSRGSLKRGLQRAGQKRIRRNANKAYVRARQASATARSIPKARRGHSWSITPDKEPLKRHVGKGTLAQRRAEAGSPVGSGYKLHRDKKPLKRHVGRGTAGQRLAEKNYSSPHEAMRLIRRAAANRAYSPWKKLQGEYAQAKSKGRALGKAVETAKAKAQSTVAAAKRARYGASSPKSGGSGGGWFSKLTERKKALGTLSQALADQS